MDQIESLPAAFGAELDQLQLAPGRLLVAVSGGPDSVALLDLLTRTADERGLELIVGHVDHGIDPASGSVAAGVRRLAEEYGLPLVEQRLALGRGATETVARAARYRALEAMRLEARADFIVTAHHADDQAETVLMRALRGSGPAGLAGMEPRRGRILRPLLSFRRAVLARHLLRIEQHGWDDPANADPRHLRSWVRQQLIPLLVRQLPDVHERLTQVAEQARIDRAGWDAVLDLVPGLDYRSELDGASVDLKALEATNDNLLLCIAMAVGRRSNISLGPSRGNRVVDLVRTGGSGAQVPLGSGWIAELAFDRLRVVSPPVEPVRPEVELAGPGGFVAWAGWRFTWRVDEAPGRQERTATTAWFEPERLRVRACRNGDKLMPLGGLGRRPIVRCLQDARVPRSRRRHWPALEHDGTVVWVPGICRSDLLIPRPGAEALRVDAELA
jgi:tRNA(Ile)-lysidine synthase